MIKVGVTTGLYYIARAEELATSLKKIGYALSKGSNAIEISGDTPHEIDYTLGEEIRVLAEKQGIDLCFHGSLTTPFEIPERSDWRDAHEHVEKSIRSALFSGCKYVLFHACLHFWLEMITFTSSKLEIVMCDHMGRIVSDILKDDERLRNWFSIKMWEYERQYPNLILREEDMHEAHLRAAEELRLWADKETERRYIEEVKKNPPKTELEKRIMEAKIREEVSKEGSAIQSKKQKHYMTEKARERMASSDPEVRRWKIETYGKMTDCYDIIAHHMFYKKDPLWLAMTDIYKEVLAPYKMDYSDDWWVDKAWKLAQDNNDRQFKEFWYATIGAKYLEGHMTEALSYLNDKLPAYIKNLNIPEAEKPKLLEIAKKLKITIEMPDARDPRYAGQYILWHPKQIYAAIKTIRKTLNTNRIYMTIDWEHIAGQGVDPILEIINLEKIAPDFGRYVLSVHSNTPNPLHAHYPVELGDTELYKLNWFLRKTGFGKQPGYDVYLWFERGGGDDPFRQSVDALKLCAKFLERDVPPEELPEEYFGVKLTGMDFWRQENIMRDRRFEPLKDLLEMPEEEWGMLSSVATKKGKTKEFKKEELK